MPELPEVETTTRGLRKTVVDLTIKDVWTDLRTKDKRKRETVANPKYFVEFRKSVRDKKIKSIERRAKNILINLYSGKTILVHMKMTGHLLYGDFQKVANMKGKTVWQAKNKKSLLADPFNRFIHFVFLFSGGKSLAFSDMRKFGKITLLDTKLAHDSKHLKDIGIDPFDKNLSPKNFEETLKRKPKGKIKTILMDQTLVSGIGNIYSDEILWRTGINPEQRIKKIKKDEFKKMFKVMREVLKKGIDFGGDSMSDYRNLSGEKGKFQLHHEAYRRMGEKCRKKGCGGIIKRKTINGRSAHFCSKHQK